MINLDHVADVIKLAEANDHDLTAHHLLDEMARDHARRLARGCLHPEIVREHFEEYELAAALCNADWYRRHMPEHQGVDWPQPS